MPFRRAVTRNWGKMKGGEGGLIRALSIVGVEFTLYCVSSLRPATARVVAALFVSAVYGTGKCQKDRRRAS